MYCTIFAHVVNALNVTLCRGRERCISPDPQLLFNLCKENATSHEYFQRVNLRNVFGLKLLCLAAWIFGMYFFVRLALHQPIFVNLMFLILLFNGIAIYSIMWDNVFAILASVDQIRRELRLQMQSSDRLLARTLVRFIACVAVRVGNFRQMERNPTLIYLDFVMFITVTLAP